MANDQRYYAAAYQHPNGEIIVELHQGQDAVTAGRTRGYPGVVQMSYWGISQRQYEMADAAIRRPTPDEVFWIIPEDEVCHPIVGPWTERLAREFLDDLLPPGFGRVEERPPGWIP